MRKPNLIVFLPDQQRTDTIACYPGGARVHSPNLAKLASQSVVFERAYVTQPVCTPSRSSLLSGLWPHQNGCVRNNIALDPKYPTLIELLEDQDYHAGYMGKWHLGDENTPQRGFRDWVSTEGASNYRDYLVDRGYKADLRDGTFSVEFVARLPLELSKPQFLQEHACRFIAQHRAEPFILFVAFVEPHSPYFGPLNDEHPLSEIELSATATTEDDPDIPLRFRLMRQWQEEQARLDRQRLPAQYYFGATPEEYRVLKQRYLGLVTMIDLSIGKILEEIERHELHENTIVVHTSDHGDMLGSHHLFGKEVMFDEAARVPWLVRMPSQRTSSRVAQPVSHIDFVPTLLELLGRGVELPGRSLAPILRGEVLEAQPAFLEWSPNRAKIARSVPLFKRRAAKRAMDESTRTVLTPAGWKLSLRDKDLSELYNLVDDPLETCNLFDSTNCKDIVARGSDLIRAWQRRTGDSLEL